MKFLVVFAHPNPKSFCHALLESTVEILKSAGHEVKVRDLYANGFDPVLKASDIQALMSGALASDVKVEQELVSWADTIVTINPIWWTGFPAILKGWIDRVLTHGFAFSYTDKGVLGLLNGKTAVLISTQGNPDEVYVANGMFDAMERTQDNGVFKFCGLDVRTHRFFAAVPFVSAEVRASYLAELPKVLLGA